MMLPLIAAAIVIAPATPAELETAWVECVESSDYTDAELFACDDAFGDTHDMREIKPASIEITIPHGAVLI